MSRSNFRFLSNADRKKIELFLSDGGYITASIIIRLAWQLGLSRSEIFQLRCNNFTSDCTILNVNNRSIPVEASFSLFYKNLIRNRSSNDHIVISNRTLRPITHQAISTIVSRKMSELGLEGIKLKDLRADFILRALARFPLEYVSRISSLNIISLQTDYLPFVETPYINVHTNSASKNELTKGDVDSILSANDDPMIRNIVHLMWGTDISLKEIANLTWDDINFEKHSILTLAGKTDLPPEVEQWMKSIRGDYTSLDRVFLSPRSHKPINADRISKIAREFFVRQDCPQATLRKIQALGREYRFTHYTKDMVFKILYYLSTHERISTLNASNLLKIDRSVATKLLYSMEKDRKIISYGGYFYKFAPDHWSYNYQDKIYKYISQHPNCTRTDIEIGLHSFPRSSVYVLTIMEKNGTIIKTGRTYSAQEST